MRETLFTQKSAGKFRRCKRKLENTVPMSLHLGPKIGGKEAEKMTYFIACIDSVLRKTTTCEKLSFLTLTQKIKIPTWYNFQRVTLNSILQINPTHPSLKFPGHKFLSE